MKKIQEHLGLVFLIIIAIFAVAIGGYFTLRKKAFLLGMIFITKSVQISLCTTQSTMLNEQKMILFTCGRWKKTECFLYHERGSGHVFICG